jgi:hypothetical protein
MMLTANGCDSNAVTWQQAQVLGLLPADYLNCTECVPHNRFYVHHEIPYGENLKTGQEYIDALNEGIQMGTNPEPEEIPE